MCDGQQKMGHETLLGVLSEEEEKNQISQTAIQAYSITLDPNGQYFKPSLLCVQ